ncbi:MAG: undecaprenyl-diphosphate phosphatase [Sphingobacteriaceae bacterium]|nr:undecaprenyl-diphosphate phosphatase [Cytophagaceae bacterium]
MTLLQTLILAIVEGLTEYLPISSTGHMIIASSLMGIQESPFVKLFTVNVQLGAILAVLVLYFRRFFQSFDFYFKLLVAFLPAVVLGLLLNDLIDSLLESVTTVAISLLVGGVILLFVDRWFQKNEERIITYPKAFTIGLFQCISMIPGVSRSAATIVGGMAQGLSRKQAAEFSFFLAVPTMFAASAKKMYDFYEDSLTLSSADIQSLAIGNAVAFVVAMLAIRFFINFLTRYGFRAFGWYRIVVGLVLLGLLASGVKLSIV